MVVVIGFWIGFAALFGMAWWVSVPRAHDRALVQAGSPQRIARLIRWAFLRPGLWMLSWPHAIFRIAGLTRFQPDRCAAREIPAGPRSRLFRFDGEGDPAREPVLIVHALVSSSTILDLSPERSLIAALIREGHRVYLLDWESGRMEASTGFDDCVDELLAAERAVLADAGATRLHMVAYCSGATLALARLASLDAGPVASLAVLAAPVDLAVPSGMSVTMNSRWVKPVLALDADGFVPGPLIRESFHALRPAALRSALAALRLRDPRARADQAVLASWAWNMPPVPGALFFDSVRMYRTNELWNGTMTVGGRRADLSSIAIPILCAVATRDHICPAGSSLALAGIEALNVSILTVPSGHVSMLTGSSARRVVWPRLSEWIHANTAPQPKRRRRAISAGSARV